MIVAKKHFSTMQLFDGYHIVSVDVVLRY